MGIDAAIVKNMYLVVNEYESIAPNYENDNKNK